jgi:ABC-type uncharacterized transport system auxiliary subunit
MNRRLEESVMGRTGRTWTKALGAWATMLAFSALLAGCATIGTRTPTANFQLQPSTETTASVASRPSGRRPVVAVERPLATGAMASDRLVVTTGGALQFVSGARWEDELPDLVAVQIAQALQRSGRVDVVDEAQRGGRAGYSLVTVLQQMQVAIADDLSGQATTRIAARLVRLPAREVIATQVFNGAARASDDRPETLTSAINQATAQALSGLSEWVADGVARGGA